MMYFDANATSAMRPVAVAAITQAMQEGIANPSSVHSAGRRQRAVVRKARNSLLALAQVTRSEAQLIFTSGGTESCQLLIEAFLGSLKQRLAYPGHIVVSTIEHAAMSEGIDRLAELGWRINRIGVDGNGRVDVDQFVSAVKPDTALVSLMTANNETGALQPIREVAEALRAKGYAGPIVSDMAQGFVKSPISVASLFAAGVDGVAVSGHKLGAPAGIGSVLFAKTSQRCFQLQPSIVGGPQEDRMRAGTENVLGIVGFGAVAEELLKTQEQYRAQLSELRERLWSKLPLVLNGLRRITPLEQDHAICNTLSVAIEGCRADDLVVALDLLGLAASSGAACSSGKQSRSRVIEALDIPETLKDSVLRLSLDWSATSSEVDDGVDVLQRAVTQMRKATQTAGEANAAA